MAKVDYRTAPVKSTEMPKGIPYIIGNEAAERFSFYGMRGILVVFMVHYLMQPGGQLDTFTDTQAKFWFHLFVGSAYFFPLIGALISDAIWGKYRTIITLSIVYCAGHACLAFMGVMGNTHTWLFAGLALIAVGSGGIKPCVSAHVGDQFGNTNGHLLSRVFGWFYFSINFGAFLSGMLTPFLLQATPDEGMGQKIYPQVKWIVGHREPGEAWEDLNKNKLWDKGEKFTDKNENKLWDKEEKFTDANGNNKYDGPEPFTDANDNGKRDKAQPIFGPHYAFGLPGILMALATLMFWMGRHKFVHIQPRGAKAYFRETFSGEGIGAIGRVSVIFAFIIVFWSLFDQTSTTWLQQAEKLDRVIPQSIPLLGGIEMLPAQVSNVFNPLFILLLIPVFNYGLYPLINRVFPLTPLRKIGIGLFTMSVAFGTVAVVQMALDAGHTPHMGWQIFACFLLTAAEVMVSITGLEFAYTQAPRQMKSFILSLYLLTVSLGNFLTSGVTWVFMNEQGKSRLSITQELWFWAGLIFLAAAVFIFVARKYQSKEYLQEEADAADAEQQA